MAGGTAPLRLKDLLELDCDSCSAAGFRCYPRRLLCESSAPPALRHLLDSPSLSSLRRRRPSKLSSISRSLSRRLGSRSGLFWRRCGEDADADEEDAAAAAAPGGSGSESGASSSDTTSDNSSSAGRRGSRCESDSDFSTATSASDSMDAAAAAAAAAGDEHEAMKRGSRSSSGSSEADDKEEQQQLSPVAVMDFPSDDDEADADRERDDAVAACSPSFSLARLQRRKMLRTQHKIRRFASTQELGSVDLEARLAATSGTADLADDVPAQLAIQCHIKDAAAAPRPSRSHRGAGVVRHEPNEHALLALLKDAGADHVSGRLLLDFVVEMKRRRKAERWGDGEVLAAARGWLDGAGSERWGLNDVLRGGEAVLEEMERARRWMRVGEEEREVGAVVAGMLADQLLDEVVWDLLLV